MKKISAQVVQSMGRPYETLDFLWVCLLSGLSDMNLGVRKNSVGLRPRSASKMAAVLLRAMPGPSNKMLGTKRLRLNQSLGYRANCATIKARGAPNPTVPNAPM